MPKKSSSTIRPKNTSGRGKRHTVRPTNASTGRMNRSKNSSTDNGGGGRGSSSNTGGSSSALSSRTRKAIDNLPSHAQKIYREAHKNAVKQYSNPSKRRGGKQQSKEQIAHKVAWSAVKKEYRKKGEKWEQITD
jgi:cation transport regulator